MFILAISYLTASNLPWFMDLTFQLSKQYCSLQHQTLFRSPVTFTTGRCFRFGSVSSFFLELFLHSSPVAYWAPTTWEFIFQCYIFLPFHTVHGVLKARMLKQFAIPFSSGPFCQNSPPWLFHLGWTYIAWFIVSLNQTRLYPCDQFGWFSVIVVFILSALWWMRIRSLWKLPNEEGLAVGKIGTFHYTRQFIGMSSLLLSFELLVAISWQKLLVQY